MGKLLDFFRGNRQEEDEERARQELEALRARYGDGNTLDPEKALSFLLHVGLHGACGTPEQVEGDHLVLPAWNAVLTPVVSQLTGRGVVLDFYLSAPQWGRELYECCAGMGNSPGQAQGMAVGSFSFAFMDGIARMERREDGIPVKSSFAGQEHRWHAYLSGIVGMGKLQHPKETHPDVYWNALKDDIIKRLGNQRLCYVKIYGAKVGDDITGECRIDDVKSEELSARVAEMVSRWEVEGFASQKQFFFLRQEEETVRPGPCLDREGLAELKQKVIQAANMFNDSWGTDDFDTLEPRLTRALGDHTLAVECMRFLPEFCAEYAYREQVSFSESIQLIQPGRVSLNNEVYKSQLAHYYPMGKALMESFDEGVFGDRLNDIYRALIGYSATYAAISQARQSNKSLEGGCLSALLIRVDKDFELR